MECSRLFLLLGAFLLALTGCAGFTDRGDDAATLAGPRFGVADAPGQRWWAVRFGHHWPVGADPDWSRDLLLADAIVRPVLLAHEQSLPRWRFHRRAMRSPAGHQFSFIFYADEVSARRVYAGLEASPLLRQLRASGLLVRLRMHDTGNADPGATSDPSWPPELQQHWPLFIMGASGAWLHLVGDCRAGAEVPALLADALAFYRGCEHEVDALWREWGQHAFLHHLSGVFGYRPLLLRKELRF